MLETASETTRSSPAREALRVNLIVGRARLRLSQEALAKRAGLSRPTISRIERCAAPDVGLDVIERLSTALETSVSELFAPVDEGPADDAEIARRAAAPDDDYIDADALIAAMEEAARPAVQRYSRAGRPPVAR